jgi:hypothetical protein
MANDHHEHLQKYISSFEQQHVESIVKYCGIALSGRDSSLVAASDKEELDRIRDGFAKKKLGAVDNDVIEDAINKVAQIMKAENNKPRVTFYYLLAKELGALEKLS